MNTLDAAQKQTLALEDLVVGQVFRSGTHQLDEKQIIEFAKQFDPQPFHLNNEAAKDTLFAGLAASGWHTAAITMRLLVQSAPIFGGLIGAGAEINWPRPTRPTDELYVETEVKEIKQLRSRSDRGIVVVCSTTKNQHGDVLQTLTSKLVVPKRSV